MKLIRRLEHVYCHSYAKLINYENRYGKTWGIMFPSCKAVWRCSIWEGSHIIDLILILDRRQADTNAIGATIVGIAIVIGEVIALQKFSVGILYCDMETGYLLPANPIHLRIGVQGIRSKARSHSAHKCQAYHKPLRNGSVKATRQNRKSSLPHPPRRGSSMHW